MTANTDRNAHGRHPKPHAGTSHYLLTSEELAEHQIHCPDIDAPVTRDYCETTCSKRSTRMCPKNTEKASSEADGTGNVNVPDPVEEVLKEEAGEVEKVAAPLDNGEEVTPTDNAQDRADSQTTASGEDPPGQAATSPGRDKDDDEFEPPAECEEEPALADDSEVVPPPPSDEGGGAEAAEEPDEDSQTSTVDEDVRALEDSVEAPLKKSDEAGAGEGLWGHLLQVVGEDGSTITAGSASPEHINAWHQSSKELARRSVVHACIVGLALLDRKENAKHGTFKPWIAENCSFSYSTAAAYMKVAKWALEKFSARDLSWMGMSIRGVNRLIPAPARKNRSIETKDVDETDTASATSSTLDDQDVALVTDNTSSGAPPEAAAVHDPAPTDSPPSPVSEGGTVEALDEPAEVDVEVQPDITVVTEENDDCVAADDAEAPVAASRGRVVDVDSAFALLEREVRAASDPRLLLQTYIDRLVRFVDIPPSDEQLDTVAELEQPEPQRPEPEMVLGESELQEAAQVEEEPEVEREPEPEMAELEVEPEMQESAMPEAGLAEPPEEELEVDLLEPPGVEPELLEQPEDPSVDSDEEARPSPSRPRPMPLKYKCRRVRVLLYSDRGERHASNANAS